MAEKLHIFKIGGGIIDKPEELHEFLTCFSAFVGLKVLVHGGGKGASKFIQQLGITPKMEQGRRITNKETLDAVTMYYAGYLNKNIVACLQSKKVNAMGLCGADANLITASKRPVKEFDFGWVGDVKPSGVNNQTIELLLNNNIVPVFSAITHNQIGDLLNTNADTIAANVAISLSQTYHVTLHYCFDKIGVLRDLENEDSMIAEITPNLYSKLKREQVIYDGMIPKLDNAFDVLNQGVERVILEHPKNINTNIKTIVCKD